VPGQWPEALASTLWGALANRTIYPDNQLPGTGVALGWERALSAAFVDAPAWGYGTRTSLLMCATREIAPEAASQPQRDPATWRSPWHIVMEERTHASGMAVRLQCGAGSG
jgi:hypothetical protein